MIEQGVEVDSEGGSRGSGERVSSGTSGHPSSSRLPPQSCRAFEIILCRSPMHAKSLRTKINKTRGPIINSNDLYSRSLLNPIWKRYTIFAKSPDLSFSLSYSLFLRTRDTTNKLDQTDSR
ncbi:hypothetical protein PUN28_011020 [Cardiocondyla obscurior]|uniref:Uncharacterized protein n=1 Tax=Cardiocondyla obscurior TaxID=286306 RepID=A0AAW2FIR7_9HYME